MVEVYEYENEPIYHQKKVREKRKRNVDQDDFKSLTRRADNILRLSNKFRRIVRANLNRTTKPSFLTLTMYAIVGIDESYSAFNLFIRRLRKNHGSNFKYIAVPEFQKRGACHFHVLIWGLSEIMITNERKNRYLQHLWQRGYLDCIPTDGSPKLASYLAKYMSKSMHDPRLLRKKSFTASRNLMRPLLSRFTETFNERSHGLLDNNHQLIKQKIFQTQWLGQGKYSLYLDPQTVLPESYPQNPELSTG